MATHPSARHARRLLRFGTAGVLLGIALAVVAVPGASLLTVVSLLLLVVGLHRFGRSGPDRRARRAV